LELISVFKGVDNLYKYLSSLSKVKADKFLLKTYQIIKNERGGGEIPTFVWIIGSCALLGVALLAINALLPGTISTLWNALLAKLTSWISGIGSI
jgi:hypothetical protein